MNSSNAQSGDFIITVTLFFFFDYFICIFWWWFDTTLITASDKISESTGTIAISVESISEASSQLNSLLFPIIASIGVIVALQITIIARRR